MRQLSSHNQERMNHFVAFIYIEAPCPRMWKNWIVQEKAMQLHATNDSPMMEDYCDYMETSRVNIKQSLAEGLH